MKMAFKVELEVPDPIGMNIDVLRIGDREYCTFTGLETGKCECGYYKPEGRFADASEFTGYVLTARSMRASLFYFAAGENLVVENNETETEEEGERAWKQFLAESPALPAPRVVRVAEAKKCAYPEGPCSCKNGIGCVNVPVSEW